MNYTPEQTAGFHQHSLALIRVNEQDHVLRIRLNRPEKKNALNRTLLWELAFALHYARHHTDVWAVVLEAEGDVFCSGADLKGLMGGGLEGGSTIPTPKGEVLLAELFRDLHRPCIAQVEGDVLAGGMLLLTGCTHVIASNDIHLALPEVKRGLFPFQVLAALLEVMPARQAVDWCLRGYPLDAEQACELGLITQVCIREQIRQEVNALLKSLLANSPSAIRLGLEAYARLRDEHAQERHQYLMGMLMKTMQTQDAREGIAAFKEKREPVWKGS